MTNKKKQTRYFKGFIGDIGLFVFIIFLIIPAITAITFKYISLDVSGVLANVITAPSALAMSNQVAGLTNIWDYIIPFWAIAACIAVMVYAAFLKSSPITFGIGFVYLCFMTFIWFYLSNSFYTIVTTNTLTQAATYYPNTLFLIEYTPVIVGVLT